MKHLDEEKEIEIKNICEHELILIDENWMSEDSLLITTECQKCKNKYKGLLLKYS